MKRALLVTASIVLGVAIVAGIPIFARTMLSSPGTAPPAPLETPARAVEEPVEAAPLEVYPAFPVGPPGPGPKIAALTAAPGPPLLAAADALALEKRLEELSYMVGPVDGNLDGAFKHGLIAFQKREGLPRSGQPDPPTLAKIQTATTPSPNYSTPPRHIEVDVTHQVIMVVDGGRVVHTLPTSTGTGKKFTSQGWTRRAVTPNGAFAIFGKRPGWRKSPLGMLYRPAYFNGGIALHGSKSVPTSPASHGCVRVPMAFADWFADNVAQIGTVVYVYGNAAQAPPLPVTDGAALLPPPPPPTDVPLPEYPGPPPPPGEPQEPPLLGIL